MMTALQKTIAIALVVLLGVMGYGLWSTRQPTLAPVKIGKSPPPAADPSSGVDETTLLTAQRLAQLAVTADEQTQAQSATRLADHELELAFTAALRQIEAHPPVLSPEAQKIQDRLQKSQKMLDSDQATVTQLTAALAQANGAQKSSMQDQLDLAQSQLELDRDEVDEANQDLLGAGGNQHQRIQMMMQEHSAAEHSRPPAATGPDPLANLHGLVHRIREWLALRKKQQWVEYAQELAGWNVQRLSVDRQKLAAQLEADKESVPQLAHHTKRARGSGSQAATKVAEQNGSTAQGESAPQSAAAPRGAQSAQTAPAAVGLQYASASQKGSAAKTVASQSGTAAQNASSSPNGAPAQNAVAQNASGSTNGASAKTPTSQRNASAQSAVAAQGPSGSQNAAAQPSTADPPPGAVGGATVLSLARQIAADQKLLTLLDQRISDQRQLAGVYQKWTAAVGAEARSVLHTALQTGAAVLGILLLLLFLDGWLERLLGRTRLDRRQVETLRSVTRVSLQILGVLIVLLMLIGLPGQVGTMLGIVGAGLTVALKDFIVAFIGWLVLMGKNGMRLGDWVEINGVSGEVVELNMFHTVLLETGNWTDAGHPTGRRVTFTNSFAIQGHYFNFSTSGQWLWDELLVLVPYERDPHVIAEAIHKEVIAATAESSQQAEQEWRRAARTRRDATISAAPAVVVKPGVGGVEIAVRYVTRASDRFTVRARLYQSAVTLLAQSPRALPPAA